MRRRILSVCLATLTQLPYVVSWGEIGHEIVATIAQIHIHPSVYKPMCNILDVADSNSDHPLCYLAPIAGWADKVRHTMHWSEPLHFVNSADDHPRQNCEFPGPNGWSGKKNSNILYAAGNVTDILEQYVSGSDSVDQSAANEALKFLVHFIGDMHQPLHLTGRDKGGNEISVCWKKRHTNLHAVWDTDLIEEAINETDTKYDQPLSQEVEFALRGTNYDSYIRRIFSEGILQTWRKEKSTWPICPAFDQPNTLLQHVLTSVRSITGFGTLEEAPVNKAICSMFWAKPIHKLNCDVIWLEEFDQPPYTEDSQDSPSRCIEEESDSSSGGKKNSEWLELDTPRYAGVIKDQMIVEKLLAQAGIRLASVLNYLFADQEGKNYHLQVFDI